MAGRVRDLATLKNCPLVAAANAPCNFLDQLIHELGGPDAVAEMTGRWGWGINTKLHRRHAGS